MDATPSTLFWSSRFGFDDMWAALINWVEHGKAPGAGDIIQKKYVEMGDPSQVAWSRPLCPYPQVARYIGTGSIDDAANFVCELKGLDRADEASDFDHGLKGRNNARRQQAK